MREPSHVRNFALIGHSHDGKTTLGECMLEEAGAIAERGSVEAGTSHLDTAPEAKEGHNRHSVTSAIFSFDWNDHSLTLVDTPGDPNFQADGRIALAALDAAVLVVSSLDGVKFGSERMWRASREAGCVCLAFVNGMDRERADFDRSVDSLRKLGANPVVVALPVGAGPEFRGVIDLLAMRCMAGDGEGEIPAELAEVAETAHQQLVEAVAESDDELLELYLEEGQLGAEETRRGLLAGVRAGRLTPVLCGSAESGLGVRPLLEALVTLVPSPAEHAPRAAVRIADGGEVGVTGDADAPFAAIVFKTIVDRYAGTLSVMRVVSGRLHADSTVRHAAEETKLRVGKLQRLLGAEHREVSEAGPGEIVAVAKLKDVHTGQSLTDERDGVRLPAIPIPEGVLSYAIEAGARGDEEKAYASLARLVEEDPTLRLHREESTGEFLLTGMGELHIRVTIHKLARLFDLEVELRTPKVPYRETISRKVEHVEGKLKKQTGGKGMFGVCFLGVEPLARGGGFEFSDEIVGGAIPRGLIPAVEKGVREAMEAGPIAGFPVVDVRVRCVDGKHHPVDSNEMAFKLAGSFGFKAALEQARPILLEPVMRVEVSTPDDHVGDVMGDLSSRRGRVQASEARGTATVIQAQVPMSEMLEYSSALTSITGGQGGFHMEFSHYDEAPAQVREKVLAAARGDAGGAT